MEVVGVPADQDFQLAHVVLASIPVEVHGECDGDDGGHLLLVGDAPRVVATLADHAVSAVHVRPPTPDSHSGVLWWKRWRLALDPDTYGALRGPHHAEIDSVGSIVRVRQADTDHPAAQTWRVLSDGGVDVRCEYQCHLPTGLETHFLVPDDRRASAVLAAAGIPATPADYTRPGPGDGIVWWGQWEPATAFAREVQRPMLLSFASPRVEQVPGVW